MTRIGDGLALFACGAALCAGSSLIAQRHGRPTSPQTLSPREYAARTAGIQDCATFKEQVSGLPNAAPLLVSMVAGAGADADAFSKGEFETTAQYDARIRAWLTSKLGDPDHLFIRVPIEAYRVSYDADTQISTVKYMLSGTGYSQELQFSSKDDDTRHYVGSNAFGVTADVTAIRSTKDALFFRKRQLNAEQGGVFSPNFSVSLPPEQAQTFKDHASLLLWARLTAPHFEGKSHYSGATLDSPYAVSTRAHKLNVELQCAYLGSSNAPIADVEIIDRPASYDRDPLTGAPS